MPVVAPIAIGAIILGGWQVTCTVLAVPDYLFPAPSSIWHALCGNWPTLFHALRAINQLWYWSLLLGAAVAAVLTIRQRRRAGEPWVDWWLLPYCIVAYLSAVAVVFSGQTRFHYPAMPLLCLACGWLLAIWAERGAARSTAGAGQA